MADSVAPGAVHVQLVDAMRSLAGPHPGVRPAHAKGIVCSGTFRAAADARRMSKAPHLQGQPVPAVIRFSNSTGNPDVHDGLAGVRAMSVKFQLVDNSIEGFPVRTPEEFLAFLRAQLPDPATGKPVPDAVPRFVAGHPTAGAFIERLMKKPVPASYAQAGYHAEHAFLFTAADGQQARARPAFIPGAQPRFAGTRTRCSATPGDRPAPAMPWPASALLRRPVALGVACDPPASAPQVR